MPTLVCSSEWSTEGEGGKGRTWLLKSVDMHWTIYSVYLGTEDEGIDTETRSRLSDRVGGNRHLQKKFSRKISKSGQKLGSWFSSIARS